MKKREIRSKPSAPQQEWVKSIMIAFSVLCVPIRIHFQGVWSQNSVDMWIASSARAALGRGTDGLEQRRERLSPFHIF